MLTSKGSNFGSLDLVMPLSWGPPEERMKAAGYINFLPLSLTVANKKYIYTQHNKYGTNICYMKVFCDEDDSVCLVGRRPEYQDLRCGKSTSIHV
jgi:hypothetical protein